MQHDEKDETVNLSARNKFFDLSLDMLCVANFEGRFLDVNAAFTRVLGYSREDLLAQPFFGFIHPDDIEATQKELGQLAEGNDTLQFENRYRHKDGHYLTIGWKSKTDTKTGLVYAVARDITSQVAVSKNLARTVSILNETNAIAKVGGWELDVATGELEWTDETFRILEVERRADRKPMLPQGLLLFTAECQPIIERAVSRAIEFGEPYSLELEAKTAKGNVLWVYTNGKANYRDGKVVSLSGTIQDIHARKTAELRYEAEHRRVLRDAKMASLGELAAAMAHELNNPLGIVSAYSEVALLSPELPASVRSKLEGILRSCDRMAHIVRNLRRFSQTSEDSQDRARHDLIGIIRESITLVMPRLKGERVQLDFASDGEALTECSPTEVEQVFVNLLNNAIHAVRGSTEKWVRISIEERDQTYDVSVTDSGPGIPAELVDEVFAPFYTTKGADGTGLGLAISREILEDHGGTLSYDSAMAHTCFRATFKKALVEASAD